MSKLNKSKAGCWVLVVLMWLVLLHVVVIDLRAANKQYEEDMKCVHRLVAGGLERSDIKMVDGICYVGENIYYTSQ